MRYKDGIYCMQACPACIHAHTTDNPPRNFRKFASINYGKKKKDSKKKWKNHNTERHINATTVLIDILCFASDSSSFSIHLSTYQ